MMVFDIQEKMDLSDGKIKVVGIGGTLRGASVSLGALRRALAASSEAETEVELLDVRALDLPMYEPGRHLEDCPENVRRLVEALRGADAVIVSTAAYHGTLAGVTKNALDFVQYLSRDERSYLDSRAVGLIATAGGDLAAARSIDAMVHAAHALRGVVAPPSVAIPRAWRRSDDEGNVTDENYGARLEMLGRLVVDLAEGLSHESRGSRGRRARPALAGIAG